MSWTASEKKAVIKIGETEETITFVTATELRNKIIDLARSHGLNRFLVINTETGEEISPTSLDELVEENNELSLEIRKLDVAG